MMYDSNASTQQKNLYIENTIKITLWIDSKIPVEIYQETTTTTTLIYAIRVSGSPSKLTAHLQIHIMEKIQPQMVKEYEEQVR